MLVIAVWLITGPTFHFSDTWQLIINTATTIITFLMVFLIQNTQNRDAKAVHLKLDEIIRAIKGARNELVDLEDLSDEDLKKLEEQFRRMRTRAENDEEVILATPSLSKALNARRVRRTTYRVGNVCFLVPVRSKTLAWCAEKLCRWDTIGKPRTGRNPASAHNNAGGHAK